MTLLRRLSDLLRRGEFYYANKLGLNLESVLVPGAPSGFSEHVSLYAALSSYCSIGLLFSGSWWFVFIKKSVDRSAPYMHTDAYIIK